MKNEDRCELYELMPFQLQVVWLGIEILKMLWVFLHSSSLIYDSHSLYLHLEADVLFSEQ